MPPICHLKYIKTLRLLSLLVSTLIAIFFSPIALAHPEHASMLQTIFGENFSHWLIAHQGIISVATLALLVLFMHHVIARLKG